MEFEIEENSLLEEEIEPVLEGMADLLKVDNVLVGACIKSERDNRLRINDIGIKDEFKSKGLGTVFVKMYEYIANERNRNRIEARVEEGNVRGINFWQSHVNWIRGEDVESQRIYYKEL